VSAGIEFLKCEGASLASICARRNHVAALFAEHDGIQLRSTLRKHLRQSQDLI
jgi:hypothetical protein